MVTVLMPYAAPAYFMLKLKMHSDMELMSTKLIISSGRDFQNAQQKEDFLFLTWHTEKHCGCLRIVTMKIRNSVKKIKEMKKARKIQKVQKKKKVQKMKEL